MATGKTRVTTYLTQQAPWLDNPFKLISLREILSMPRMFDAEGYPLDEVKFGRFFNLLYMIGVLEQKPLTQESLIVIEGMADLAAQDMERWGFFVTAKATRHLSEMLRNPSRIDNREAQMIVIRQALMGELEARVFVPVAPEKARYYREPTKDWEEIISHFEETVTDIEEASRCYALGRYAACVYHTMQIMEHGLLRFGVFMGVTDPKSGFTAVANSLQRILNKRYEERSDFERKHYSFFEQLNGSVQAMKNAWRNKIDHAQGVSILLTPDFTPDIALEIYMAVRGFMRRLATEMPL